MRTYFSALCAGEFSGPAHGVWVLALCPRCPSPVVPSGPSGSSQLSLPSPPYSWRRGLLLSELWAGSVSWGPLRPAVSLAARTCQSARHGSGGSIPASIPASQRRRRWRPRPPLMLLFPSVSCSLAAFHLERTIGSARALRSLLLEKEGPSPARECCGSGGWSRCRQHGVASRAPGVPEPGRPAATEAATAPATPAELWRPRGCGAGRHRGAHPLSMEDG